MYRHDYGAGADVFIRLTNYTSSKESVKLTITTPNAIPREQTTKIEILPTKVERNNCKLHDPLNENAIDSMTVLTNESHLFWMSVSWENKSVNKVIVTLENENNEVLFEKELVMPSTSSNNVLWFRALNRIERLASQGGLIPL